MLIPKENYRSTKPGFVLNPSINRLRQGSGGALARGYTSNMRMIGAVSLCGEVFTGNSVNVVDCVYPGHMLSNVMCVGQGGGRVSVLLTTCCVKRLLNKGKYV